jgi:hypothetical protein
MKTPLFQTMTETTGSFTLTSQYTVTSENSPLPTSSTTYLAENGDEVFGWFRSNVGTVFGRLYKENSQYYFNMKETFSVPVVLFSTIPFLKEQRFDIEGNILTTVSESTQTKERLSSVFISNQIQTPIPETGSEIVAFYLKSDADNFDLLSYFDYNKDYLSFPLTDEVESVFLSATSLQTVSNTAISEVSASLTWEEQ